MTLCTERSTPIASTGWLMADAKVLSITESTPASRQAVATAPTSMTRSVGLIGDSNHTIFVFGPTSDAGVRNSSSVAKRVVTPKREARLVSTWKVPP